MNRSYLLLLTTFLIFLYACTRKIRYNIPADYPQNKRKELLTRLEKGRVLYKTDCSGCHGVFGEGKDGVANFSNVQIDNYSARFMRRDPQNHAVARNMGPEQMEEILSFLRFKRPANPDSVMSLRNTRRR